MPGTQKKRLIVCCDGTWQASDKTYGTSPSNIAKLSRMIAREDGNIPQVVYYQSGVGTGSWGLMDIGIAGSVGIGLSENVSSAYHYLSTNFNDGQSANDEIFIFGFSRGAYTARALSGLVTEMGLLKPQYLDKFPRAFEIYKRLSSKAANRTDNFLKWKDYFVGGLSASDRNFWHDLTNKKMYRDVKVKVVGVWDTVGALGIPESFLSTMLPGFNKRFQFHSTGLNIKIENAFQALALDEHRGAFPPTLWYLPKYLLRRADCPNLKQCWFPGYHESIGGGGVKVQSMLSDWFPHIMNWIMPDTSQIHEVTLAWMCDQVNGLLKFDDDAVRDMLLRNGEARGDWAACKETDMLKYLKVFNLNSFGGSRTRTPGRYFEEQTNETIHPSVYFRTSEVKRLHYSARPLRERFVWAYCAWLPQFHVNFATPVWALGTVFRFLGTVLFYLGAPVRAFTPSLWEVAVDLWDMGGDLVHMAAATVAHLGRLAQMFPFAFCYLDEPLWRWQQRSTDPDKPDGASWVRRNVPCSVFLQNGQEEVRIQEWVVRASPDHKFNFEKDVMPEKVWDRLGARNRKSIRHAEKSPDYRMQFWTRTDWEHRDDQPKLSHGPVHQQVTIPHPIHALHDTIHHAFGDARRVHETAHRIDESVHDNLQSLPHRIQDALDNKTDLIHNRLHGVEGAVLGAVDKAHDGVEGFHDRAHKRLDDLHDQHEQARLDKKNKKHLDKKGRDMDDGLHYGGAVQGV
ncbi:peptidoglycan binding domain containing protein [Diplodia corticola]|uniref:Peptidoglycan binding domain containing protein n=1 Tax=Diplodia corticola TaxID=236234 RepID=A0A1J9R0J7_9PEZI|nr:peptidoglycan binding domain containing protein [Diplodia corticola]OJD34121.1 peptidoglycan binding domain containing protein [Diplodia corticola]